jgi:hypothetical protein
MEQDKGLLGLDMLVNQYRKRKDEKTEEDDILFNKWYTEKLDEFKKDINNRLKVFDPYTNKSDPIDYGLFNIWLAYNWGDLTAQQLYNNKK